MLDEQPAAGRAGTGPGPRQPDAEQITVSGSPRRQQQPVPFSAKVDREPPVLEQQILGQPGQQERPGAAPAVPPVLREGAGHRLRYQFGVVHQHRHRATSRLPERPRWPTRVLWPARIPQFGVGEDGHSRLAAQVTQRRGPRCHHHHRHRAGQQDQREGHQDRTAPGPRWAADDEPGVTSKIDGDDVEVVTADSERYRGQRLQSAGRSRDQLGPGDPLRQRLDAQG